MGKTDFNLDADIWEEFFNAEKVDRSADWRYTDEYVKVGAFPVWELKGDPCITIPAFSKDLKLASEVVAMIKGQGKGSYPYYLFMVAPNHYAPKEMCRAALATLREAAQVKPEPSGKA